MLSFRGRRIIGSSLLLLSSLVLSLVLGEVSLRLLGYHGEPQSNISNMYVVDDPILDWRYIPNSEVSAGRLTMRYNSKGFRDVEHAQENTSGKQRIVVVGDSVTMGHGVGFDSMFSRALQARLGSGYEVVTIAMGGLNTPQETHLFEQSGLIYHPNLVILNFVLNDCDFFTNYAANRRVMQDVDSTIGMLNIKVDPRVKRALKSSALIYFVKDRIEDLRGRIVGREEKDYFTRIWSKEQNKERVITGFDSLKAMRDTHGFKVVVLIWPLITNYQRYDFGYVHRWVQSEAEKRGFETLDLLSAFSQYSQRQLQVSSEDNVHPNSLGHKVGVEAFLDWSKFDSISKEGVSTQ